MEFEYCYVLKKHANEWHRSITRPRQLTRKHVLRILSKEARAEGCTLGRVTMRIIGEQVLKP